MDASLLLPLIGLALIDSTSFGTLVLPVVMLVQPRIRVAALLVYLAVISAFYFVLGLVLAFAGARLADLLPSRTEHPWLAWTQLGVGALLFAVSFLVDRRGQQWRAGRRAARGLPPKTSRHERMIAKVVGPQATAGAVASVAVIAGLIEAASMLPYLAAIALIVSAGLSAPMTTLVLIGYVVLMALPALILLALRLAAARRIEPALTRLNDWLRRRSADALGWVLGIVGVLMALDAAQILGQWPFNNQ